MDIKSFQSSISAYRQSRIILTAWELDVFSALELCDGNLDEIIKQTKTDNRATRMLLDALAAYKIILKKENAYFNSDFSKQYLVKTSPDYLSGLGHSNNLWDYWSNLTKSVKEGKPFAKNDINDRDENWLKNFIEAMHSRATKQAPETVSFINLENIKTVLDIGGGSGAFSMALIEIKPDIKAIVFDLPNVIPLTQKYITREGYEQSISTIAGDYTTDNLGTGYDLAFLSAIIHSNSAGTNIDLIEKCFDALNNGGQIAISDFIMNNDRTEPVYGAEFAINMLVATSKGDTYTEEEISEWLSNAGFEKIKKVQLPARGAMMIAEKPNN